jgi:hypothetical protein
LYANVWKKSITKKQFGGYFQHFAGNVAENSIVNSWFSVKRNFLGDSNHLSLSIIVERVIAKILSY